VTTKSAAKKALKSQCGLYGVGFLCPDASFSA